MARIGAFYFANVDEVLTPAKSDTVDFIADTANNPRQYEYFYAYVPVTGNIVFNDTNDVQRTLTAVPAFTILPLPIKRLWSTGTTATVWALIPKKTV